LKVPLIRVVLLDDTSEQVDQELPLIRVALLDDTSEQVDQEREQGPTIIILK
jgi:hypothetical protein